jgi:hypothetical protein
MIVWQEITYQQGTWPMKLVLSQGEISQVQPHRLVLGRN